MICSMMYELLPLKHMTETDPEGEDRAASFCCVNAVTKLQARKQSVADVFKVKERHREAAVEFLRKSVVFDKIN